MKIRKYAVRTESTNEEKRLVTVLDGITGVEYHISRGICCFSYVHLKCTKKVWKEVKAGLGLRVVETYAAFDTEKED